MATGPTAWMTPVYPWILSLIFKIFGAYTFRAFIAAAGFNIICSAAVCIALYSIGKTVRGRELGAACAWFWAIFPNAVIMATREMWDASLGALLSVLIVLCSLRTASSRKRKDWLLYGALWGVALMTTPTLGSSLPVLGAWMIWYGRERLKETVLHVLLMLLVAVAVCLPWTIRNFEVFHTLVPLRSVMGLQLWMGNNDQSGRVWPGSLHPLSNATERQRFADEGETAYMRSKREEALSFIISNPKRFAELTCHRFVATWSGGTEHPIGDLVHQQSFYFRSILVANLLAALGALCGIVVLVAVRHPYTVPLIAFPLLFPLISYVTLASPRYRLPVDPEVLLLAALPLSYWTRRRAK